jgi:multiple RNA-binding domain-containing protein 1
MDDQKVPRSNTVILVKNIPFDTQENELKLLFGPFGTLNRVILPPTKTIALVEFNQINEAKSAFKSLAYKKFKHIPLYLEWAPAAIFAPKLEKSSSLKTNSTSSSGPVVIKENILKEAAEEIEGTTLFIKNLNFITTETALKILFGPFGRLKSVSISKKRDMKNPGQSISMGFGFIEFDTKEQAVKAIKTLQGTILDGHSLVIKFAHTEKETPNQRKTRDVKGEGVKLVIRNLPFEATKKEVSDLFKAFGQVKNVRVPKKVDGKSRGYSFVEFLTKQEASNAFEALQNTHLYGRHLIIEFAKQEKTITQLQEENRKKFLLNAPK